MINGLTADQQKRYDEFRQFVQTYVEPFANSWDYKGALSPEVLELCAKAGYLGSIIPEEYGGQGWDVLTFALLNEAFGRGSSSLCCMFTVQTMVETVLLKWGTAAQRLRWLPELANGKKLASFCLTEPNAGSDIQAIETTFSCKGDKYYLNGTKKWITMAGIADIFLVFGKLEGKPLACIVERDFPGFKVNPIRNMMGFKAAHLALLEFENCEIPVENIIGKPGFGLSHVASYGLGYGRLSTACSSTGLIRACMEESASYAGKRQIFEKPMNELQMIRQIIADMAVNLEAATLLCLNAAHAEDEHLPEAIEKTLMAKYFASRAAAEAAANAVQIFGALGCNENSNTSRYYHDSKILEIIEGTHQVHQNLLGKSFCKKLNTFCG